MNDSNHQDADSFVSDDLPHLHQFTACVQAQPHPPLPTAAIVPTVSGIRAASEDMLHGSMKTELMRRMVGIADGDTGG